VTDGTALSRGDRNRNEGLAGLRVLLPTENAILGIDLANMQAAVVTDHDSRVVARRRVRCRAWSWGRCWTGPLSGRTLRGSRR
jgi:transposase